MTAEILIMNKNAIALATDSAVTVGNQKTYTGVNKLFMLSNDPPMGIMIYNNADFMNIPLESLIKEFRLRYGCELKNVHSFMEYFLDFIKKIALEHRGDFNKYFSKIIENIYSEVKNDFDLFNKLENNPEDILRQIDLSLTDYREKFFNNKRFKKYEYDFERLVERDFDNKSMDFKKIIKEIYQKMYIIREYEHSGIIIAGFNDYELFPSFSSYDIYSIFEDDCNFFKERKSITNSELPSILPFAQTDVVEHFLLGMDEGLLNTIVQIFEDTINSYPSDIINLLDNDSKIDADSFHYLESKINKINKDNEKLVQNFMVFLETYNINSLAPIQTSIDALPREELGNMCESLIHLTSLKRKVDEGLETVGGDIDVAIISKGDGFIWAKRKHYFDSKTNPQFLKRKKFR